MFFSIFVQINLLINLNRMKKSTIILFLMTLFYNIASFSQTVTIEGSLLVNNSTISSGATINLGTNSISNVNLTAKVVIPTVQNDNYPGTIAVYYQKNASSTALVPVGGQGGNLLFFGGLNVTRSFTIALDATQFDLTGGLLYVEFTSYSGAKYKCDKIPIIKSSGGVTPVDITNASNTLCCNQTIRYGDKPNAITGNIPPNNISVSWSMSAGASSFNIEIPNTINFDYLFNTITTYRTFQSGSITKKSNTITTTVVPSPILSNTISVNMSLNADGYAEFSSLKGIDINTTASKVNLNILQDPFHINQRGDNYGDIDGFQWEFTNIDINNPIYGKKNWTSIANNNSASLSSFNPLPNSTSGNNYYLVRGIASYNGIKRVSNELKIMTRTVLYNNTICCDQTLKSLSLGSIELPVTIIGSLPLFIKTIVGTNLTYSTSYQWQSQKIGRSVEAWVDIIGATSKDYLPLPLIAIVNTRNGSTTVEATYNYRRIAKFNYQYYDGVKWINGSDSCYSNESNLGYAVNNTLADVTIYPNPVSSILNVASIQNSLNTNTIISIANSMGGIVNSNSFSLISPNLINVDVSNLLIGTYFITIQTATRNYSLTFIKN